MKKGWALVALGLAVVGCEVDNRDDNSDVHFETATVAASSTNGVPVNTTTNLAADQAEWDAIRWHTSAGPSCRGAVRVMSLSASVTSDGGKINFKWDRYPWGGMGLAHFFVWNGSGWSGGKFDWIRTGGQPVKSTENIRNGYNGLSIPPSGTPVAFAWTDANGKQRSNLAKTVWP